MPDELGCVAASLRYCELVSDDSYSERLKNTKRNDPCPCGSGRKYKKCHLEADEGAQHAATQAAKAAADSAAAAAAAAAATEGAEPTPAKKESASSAERPTARENKPSRGAAGNPRPKNLPRRKAV